MLNLYLLSHDITHWIEEKILYKYELFFNIVNEFKNCKDPLNKKWIIFTQLKASHYK